MQNNNTGEVVQRRWREMDRIGWKAASQSFVTCTRGLYSTLFFHSCCLYDNSLLSLAVELCARRALNVSSAADDLNVEPIDIEPTEALPVDKNTSSPDTATKTSTSNSSVHENAKSAKKKKNAATTDDGEPASHSASGSK